MVDSTLLTKRPSREPSHDPGAAALPTPPPKPGQAMSEWLHFPLPARGARHRVRRVHSPPLATRNVTSVWCGATSLNVRPGLRCVVLFARCVGQHVPSPFANAALRWLCSSLLNGRRSQEVLPGWPFGSFRDMPEIFAVVALEEISLSRIQKVSEPSDVDLMTPGTLCAC